MTDVEFLLLGLAAGAVYGLLGLGLVLEYRGSGIVNFAHGAMAMFIAYVFLDLRTNGNLFFPLPPFLPNQLVLGAPMGVLPAAVISLAYAVILGYVCYQVIFRFLRTASSLGKVVTSIGLMLTLESLVSVCEGKLARYKHPKHLAIVESFPRNVTGKISKPALRAAFGGSRSV